VRQFSQDDGHCFVMQEQIGDEVERLIRLVQRVYDDFGMPIAAKLGTVRRNSSARSRPGITPSAAARRARRTGMAYTSTKGTGVLRPEDRFRRHRRDRPQVAVRDDSARLPDAGAFDLKYIGADNAEHRRS
jgi:threonyl-tRNA synthetase